MQNVSAAGTVLEEGEDIYTVCEMYISDKSIRKNMLHMHYEILLSCSEQRNTDFFFAQKMIKLEKYDTEWGNQGADKQILYYLSYMCIFVLCVLRVHVVDL